MSNKHVTITADKVDPDLLLEQYRTLLRIDNTQITEEQTEALEGLFELLETIFEAQPEDFPSYWQRSE